MHTLHFDPNAPEAAVDALRDLVAGFDEPDAELGGSGRFARACLLRARHGNATQAGWDNTTLGTIRIEGHRLTADVNASSRNGRHEQVIDFLPVRLTG